MSRPVIGTCPALEQARWQQWDEPAVLVRRRYTRAIQEAGAMTVLLVPDHATAADPDEALDILDGLLLTGGADIDPATYGAAPHPQTGTTSPERDEFEIALVRCALARDMPLLGICRGMQLVNVACGGTLHQHLPEVLGSDRHMREPGNLQGSRHEVVFTEGSLAARAVNATREETGSHHHQGIDEVGDSLVVTGRCVADDLPEALEAPEKEFALGLQWHAEVEHSDCVIPAFVEAAAKRAA